MHLCSLIHQLELPSMEEAFLLMAPEQPILQRKHKQAIQYNNRLIVQLTGSLFAEEPTMDNSCIVFCSTCFQWSPLVIPHSSSSSQTLASVVSSPSAKRLCYFDGVEAGSLVCRYVHRADPFSLF